MKQLSFLLTILVLPFSIFASLQDVMLQDLEVAKYSLSVKYAPYEWKKEYLGWTLEQSFEDARAALFSKDDISFKDYQKIFKKFLLSTRDYHVRPQFYSTETAFFPITLCSVGGKYYITSLESKFSLSLDEIAFEIDEFDEDATKSSLKALNLQAGDELVAIDGVSVNEHIEQLIEEALGGDRSPTGYSLAERLLFLRMGKYGEDVPQGPFELTIRHPEGNETITATLPWFHIPEWVNEKRSDKKIEASFQAVSALLKSQESNKPSLSSISHLLYKDFSVEFAKALLDAPQEDEINEGEDDENIDYRFKGFLPPLGKVLWESSQKGETYAYLYETEEGKRYGYLYLPSFSYGGIVAEALLKEIEEALQVFNQEADALVLDICNNPGGNLIFTYALCQRLIDFPLEIPKFRQLLVAQDIYSFAFLYNVLKDLSEEELAAQENWDGFKIGAKQKLQLLHFADEMVASWKSEQSLTDEGYILGIESIDPDSSIRFTKPILLLINELDFSCADIFPAIMQDNQRAKLFGKRTAGAGGSVNSHTHTSRFGVKSYSLTGSIAFRTNGQVIENLGVTPDIPYELTLRDVHENYAGYIEAVNKAVKGLR